MSMTRRGALKVLGAAAAAAGAGVAAPAEARTAKKNAPDDLGLLYDVTRCIGCRACVTKCRDAASLTGRPSPQPPAQGRG